MKTSQPRARPLRADQPGPLQTGSRSSKGPTRTIFLVQDHDTTIASSSIKPAFIHLSSVFATVRFFSRHFCLGHPAVTRLQMVGFHDSKAKGFFGSGLSRRWEKDTNVAVCPNNTYVHTHSNIV